MATCARDPGVAAKGITKPRRRQNHCCDQCRRSKRACDATGLVATEVCSNCARTGKVCTFEKLQLTVAHLGPKQSTKESLPGQNALNSQTTSNRRPTTAQTPSLPASLLYTSDQSSCDQPLCDPDDDLVEVFDTLSQEVAAKAVRSASETSESWAPPRLPTPADSSLGQLYDTATRDAAWTLNGASLADFDPSEQDGNDTDSSVFSWGGAMPGDDCMDRRRGNTSINDDHSSRRSSSSVADPSSGTLLYRVAEKTNKSLILDSLTRIYHDTMENALSCWLTERTCPYTFEGIVDHQPPLGGNLDGEGARTWKTPLVSRICQLDRPDSILRERPLAPRENQAASRALRAAIMAFSAQWAPVTNDRIDAIPSIMGVDGAVQSCTQRPPTFSRSLQHRLWNDAHRILQETAGLDSFRVMFAQLVFSFTQKPLPQEDHARIRRLRAKRGSGIHASPDAGGTPNVQENVSVKVAITSAKQGQSPEEPGELEELKDLLNLQGPAIYLETALMRLSDKRVRLEQLGSESRAGFAHPVSITDRKSFNLLFWLVMMCDTLVAALEGRSFIVSDEDSLILRAQNPTQPLDSASLGMREEEQPVAWPPSSLADNDGLETTPWGSFFMKRDGQTKSTTRSPWPFSGEYASDHLNDATPIKVLLYRRVKRLRNLLFRRAPARKVEAGIVEALTVYEHWNKTYDDFMLTCLKHHDELSPRIQSWYTVLLGHWHLGAFLLADCLEAIDRHHMGDTLFGELRQSCRLVFEIRKTSAFQVAEVCRVGRPRYDSSFHKSRDFHTTLSEGAILTEPWTEILIRCFARGADIFLRWLSDRQSGQFSPRPGFEDRETLYNHCVNCIGGLFGLGRKSDMAYLAALSFSARLQDLPEPVQNPRPPGN